MLIGAGVLIIGGIVAVAGWRDLMAARQRLVTAKATLDQVVSQEASLQSAEGRKATAQQLDIAIAEVGVARRVLDGSLPLKLAKFVPVATRQRSGLLRLVDDSSTALGAGRRLVDQIDALAVRGKVVAAKLPLPALASFETDARAAGRTIAGLRRSDKGLLGPIGRARRDFDTLVSATGSRLQADADALGVAQRLIGAGGARRYFIALENDAEMRDQGAILSYALLTIDHGEVHVTQHGSLLTPIQVPGKGVSVPLLLKAPAPIAIPPGTASVFGSIFPTQVWQSVNASADFAFSGKSMQAMYHQATGQSIDGVIALDVPALSALLTVVGPVTIAGISQPITADNASTIMLHDLYDAFPVNQQVVRKELLSEVVTEVVNRLSAGSFDPVPLAQQLATAAAGGHMKVWSADPGEETTLERLGLGGGPAAIDADRTFHVAVENRNATKVDYYVKTAVQQKIEVTKTGTAIVRSTVTVANTSPPGAAPSYQLGPDGYGTTQPGEYWAWVLLWGPKPADQPGSIEESGLRLNQAILDRIYAGQAKQVTFVTVVPNAVKGGKLQLRYVPQPRLTAPGLSVTVQADGWTMSGPATWSGAWDKTRTLSWTLNH